MPYPGQKEVQFVENNLNFTQGTLVILHNYINLKHGGIKHNLKLKVPQQEKNSSDNDIHVDFITDCIDLGLLWNKSQKRKCNRIPPQEDKPKICLIPNMWLGSSVGSIIRLVLGRPGFKSCHSLNFFKLLFCNHYNCSTPLTFKHVIVRHKECGSTPLYMSYYCLLSLLFIC